jgi:hypothetical protein
VAQALGAQRGQEAGALRQQLADGSAAAEAAGRGHEAREAELRQRAARCVGGKLTAEDALRGRQTGGAAWEGAAGLGLRLTRVEAAAGCA